MIFESQKSAVEALKDLSKSDRHSILIEGPEGCGKTFAAKLFASEIGVDDFSVVASNVQSIRSAIVDCYGLSSPVVLCIENLDTGVSAASYTLLKFLEEPVSTVYIVVTCRNIKYIPDTIVSRSAVVSIASPTPSDLVKYAQMQDSNKYASLANSLLWKCCKTFKDIDTIFSLSGDQIKYYNTLSDILLFKDTVSNIIWKLGHYDDGAETPIDFVMRYIVSISKDVNIRRFGIDCIKELSLSRIAPHVILARYVFDCKYGR